MSTAQGLREYDQCEELWKLCERLVVDVPRVGERILYFAQGHLEELKFSTTQETHQGTSHFNLPSQILCRVLDIQLLVEPKTNKIYTCVTLLPDTESDPAIPDPTPPEIQKHEMLTFYKMLTASIREQSSILSSVISSPSMHLGVLTTASHAVKTGTMFVVYYKQRASQFVIRLNKYLEAVNNNIHVGLKFKMRFQGDDSLERSFFGTVVRIADLSPDWPDSKWRSLQVKWIEPGGIEKPECVSPWEIEPLKNADVVNVSDAPIKSKRFKPVASPWPDSQLLSDSSSLLSEHGKDKAKISALGRFCSWLCCCFK